MTQKVYRKDKKFLSPSNFISLKNIFKVALQDRFNVFILFNTVFNLKFNFEQKIYPKMRIFKNLKEILKTWKTFGKNPMATLNVLVY